MISKAEAKFGCRNERNAHKALNRPDTGSPLNGQIGAAKLAKVDITGI